MLDSTSCYIPLSTCRQSHKKVSKSCICELQLQPSLISAESRASRHFTHTYNHSGIFFPLSSNSSKSLSLSTSLSSTDCNARTLPFSLCKKRHSKFESGNHCSRHSVDCYFIMLHFFKALYYSLV